MIGRRVDLQDFVNRRARLQRLRDAKFFGSWTQALSDGKLMVAKSPQIELEPGETCSIQVFGEGSSLLMTGRLIADLGDTLAFEIQQPPKTIASTESPRVSVKGVHAQIVSQGSTFDFELADLSQDGIGGFAPVELPRGTVVQFEVKTQEGPVTGDAVVRNCRASDAPGGFRIGLQVERLNRTNRARWQAYLQSIAA